MPPMVKNDLSDRLRSFFDSEEKQLREQLTAAERREQKASAIAAALSVDKEKAELLNTKLTTSMGQLDGAGANSVQLLDLQRIVEMICQQYSAMQPKIHRIIENVLASRLSPSEPFFRYGDGQYIIAFDLTDEEEARRRCRALEGVIIRKLLGEDSIQQELEGSPALAGIESQRPPGPAVTTAAIADFLAQSSKPGGANRGGGQVRSRVDTIKDKLDRLLALLGHVATTLNASADPAASSPAKAAMLDRVERVTGLLRETERVLANATAAPPPSDGQPGATEGRAAAIDQDGLTGLLEQTLTKVQKEFSDLGFPLGPDANEEERGASVPAPTQVDWNKADLFLSYLPVWQVKKQSISTFVCGVSTKVKDKFQNMEPLIAAEQDPSIIAAIDQLLLLKAITELRCALEMNRRYVIIVPVHFSSLSKRNLRQQYINTCASLGEECRPFVIFELIYPFVGVSNLPINNAMAIVKQYGRAVFLRVGIDYPDFSDLAGAGTYSAGADLEVSALPEIELAAKVNSFKSRTERAKLRAHLYGVNTLSMATVAIGAGVDFLGGNAVATPLDSLDGIQEYQLENLFRRHGLFGAG